MQSQKTTKTTKKLLVLLGMVAVLAVLLALMTQLISPAADEDPTIPTSLRLFDPTEQPAYIIATEPTRYIPEEPVLIFPQSVDKGQLTISSLFQFSGFNPDCGGREGKDIAAILLENTSGSHLSDGLLILTMADGTKLNFQVTDLPDGERIMVFSNENKSIGRIAECVDIAYQTTYEKTLDLMEDKLEISVDGTVLAVTNISGEDLSGIVLDCHCLMGAEYFGGLTYQYRIDLLPAGKTAFVDAYDCYMGEPEVVRVTVGG